MLIARLQQNWGKTPMRLFLVRFLLFSLPVHPLMSGHALAHKPECNPAPSGVAELVLIREKFHTARGPLAEFDPCHRSGFRS